MLWFFLVPMAFGADYCGALDCKKIAPFPVIETQAVHLSVGHFSWRLGPSGPEEVVEAVCQTREPLTLRVLDIRRRAGEWFCCNPERASLDCDTLHRGKPARISVRPTVVVRDWIDGPARDSHFHAYIIPEGDPLQYRDLFARSVSSKLEKKGLFLDAAGGGRGENSGEDSYYVRADFLP